LRQVTLSDKPGVDIKGQEYAQVRTHEDIADKMGGDEYAAGGNQDSAQKERDPNPGKQKR